MVKGPGRMVLILLSVMIAALIPGLVFRAVMIKDLRSYFESGRTDLVRLITSAVETSYEKNRTWNREDAAALAVRALSLGLAVRLMDARGNLVMDTERALATLPPGSRERATLAAGGGFSGGDAHAVYSSHVLSRGNERLGSLEVRFLRTGKEDLFISHVGNFALAWSLLLAGLASAAGLFILRKTAQETHTPVRVPEPGETGKNTAAAHQNRNGAGFFPEPENGSSFRKDSGLNTATAKEEEVSGAVPGGTAEEEDADDEDVQPLALDADRIKMIVDGLDRLSKAHILGRELRKQPLELARHLQNAVERTRAANLDKEITFTLECDQGLTLSADPDCLSEIMTNLLDNAAKSLKKEGIVTVGASAGSGYVAVAVRDMGRGIRRKDLPHIFERFYRASGSGIGLGLAIVKELADACGATVEVQTERGKGTTFTIRIPLV